MTGDAEGLGREALLLLMVRWYDWSSSSSSFTRCFNRSISLKEVSASFSKLHEHAKRLLDGGRECLRLALPLVATFFSPIEAVGAGKIVVTLDAMHTAPVASSGDLITFWLSRR